MRIFMQAWTTTRFTLMTLLRGKILNYDPNWLRLAVPRNNFNLFRETVEAIVTAADFESALKIVLESYYANYFVKPKLQKKP